ncbi:hypothetical protein FOA52_015189 [Chlamydomonas sp. UWO 241]|nr:hypothetical protein FOA52_015189 [Chlamydomonas sp. UWO 241]
MGLRHCGGASLVAAGDDDQVNSHSVIEQQQEKDEELMGLESALTFFGHICQKTAEIGPRQLPE